GWGAADPAEVPAAKPDRRDLQASAAEIFVSHGFALLPGVTPTNLCLPAAPRTPDRCPRGVRYTISHILLPITIHPHTARCHPHVLTPKVPSKSRGVEGEALPRILLPARCERLRRSHRAGSIWLGGSPAAPEPPTVICR